MLFYKFTFLLINFSWTSIKYHHDLAENTGINGHFFSLQNECCTMFCRFDSLICIAQALWL